MRNSVSPASLLLHCKPEQQAMLIASACSWTKARAPLQEKRLWDELQWRWLQRLVKDVLAWHDCWLRILGNYELQKAMFVAAYEEDQVVLMSGNSSTNLAAQGAEMQRSPATKQQTEATSWLEGSACSYQQLPVTVTMKHSPPLAPPWFCSA